MICIPIDVALNSNMERCVRIQVWSTDQWQADTPIALQPVIPEYDLLIPYDLAIGPGHAQIVYAVETVQELMLSLGRLRETMQEYFNTPIDSEALIRNHAEHVANQEVLEAVAE